jgi:hypothetical protein
LRLCYHPCICWRRKHGCDAFVLLVLALIILLAFECPKNFCPCDGELVGDEDDFEDK